MAGPNKAVGGGVGLAGALPPRSRRWLFGSTGPLTCGDGRLHPSRREQAERSGSLPTRGPEGSCRSRGAGLAQSAAFPLRCLPAALLPPQVWRRGVLLLGADVSPPPAAALCLTGAAGGDRLRCRPITQRFPHPRGRARGAEPLSCLRLRANLKPVFVEMLPKRKKKAG